jgi:hypothetical protein
MNNTVYTLGDKVLCVFIDKLRDNTVAPPLQKEGEYTVQDICEDAEGNQHLDVGLRSSYNFVRSIETGEELPKGTQWQKDGDNIIHWCHPSRFILLERPIAIKIDHSHNA